MITRKLNPARIIRYLLVIVDTTAAPVLYIVGQQYSYSLNKPIHNEDFHTYSMQ